MQLTLCQMLSSSSYVCYGLYNHNLNPIEAVSFQHQRDDTVTNLQSEQDNVLTKNFNLAVFSFKGCQGIISLNKLDMFF